MIGTVKTHNPTWNDKGYVDDNKSDVKVLGAGKRDWQLACLKQFKNSRFNRLVAPCGSGKSLASVALAVMDVVNSDYMRLQLIAVPQVHIADGFFTKGGVTSTLSILGKLYTASVSPRHNFCQDSSIEKLKNLLLLPRKQLAKLCDGNNLSGLFAMTSYSALVLAWDLLSHKEKIQAIKNLHLRLDESHHISAGDEPNKIGKIIQFIAEYGDQTSRITMTTATDFRGDKKDILPPAVLKALNSYRVDWIEHWRGLGIKDLIVEIGEVNGSPVKQVVRNVNREPNEPAFIVVPPRNAGWRKKERDESAGIDDLVQRLQQAHPNRRIHNLVPDEERAAKKQGLIDEPKRASDGDSKYDIIITCMLGREGTDWCPCSRMHVTYVEGSITLAVQTLGRMLRRFEGKTKVVARYYYPTFPTPKNGVTKDELLDRRKNALLLLMQIEEMYFPILFPVFPRRAAKPKTERKNHEGSLEELIGTTEYRNLREDFLDDASEQGIMGMDLDAPELAVKLDAVIEELLDELEIPAEYYEDVTETLRVWYLRAANPKFSGIDIAFVREHGFPELLAKLSDTDRTLVFKHGTRNMKLLRQIVRNEWQAHLDRVKKVVGKNPAILKNAAAFIEAGGLERDWRWLLYTKRMVRDTETIQ